MGRHGWLTGKESARHCRRHRRCRFNSWVRKIPERRKWQPAPVFLPGESHGLRSWQTIIHGVAKSWTWLSDWAKGKWLNHIWHFKVFFFSIPLFMYEWKSRTPLYTVRNYWRRKGVCDTGKTHLTCTKLGGDPEVQSNIYRHWRQEWVRVHGTSYSRGGAAPRSSLNGQWACLIQQTQLNPGLTPKGQSSPKFLISPSENRTHPARNTIHVSDGRNLT